MFRAFENLPSDAVYDTLDSPVGRLTLVASGEGLHALAWARDGDDVELVARRSPRHPVLASARAQLREYFARKRRAFDLPLAPRGTAFQLRAWRELSKIPYGTTISYGEQARRVGDARKARAVGTANGSNPLSIIVPCHRVIASTGALTGFGGGLANKRYLLDLEATEGGR
ncbi:MAG: methylated-DNA--[protein]-cysteine S-methyltransferase [Deltaproteobacteria bacterium]|nr:methylated-DNA--[protein]-cysteine S-methyltransferase [Deltaproteobacteria bacterium]